MSKIYRDYFHKYECIAIRWRCLPAAVRHSTMLEF
jgi:hypothetical protein